jgi:predicted metal-dependent hydrolase
LRFCCLTELEGGLRHASHQTPHEVIDYIILHEVCHLKVKGHSHHYWDLVYRYMPDHQEKINWLNINGKILIGSDKITSDLNINAINN